MRTALSRRRRPPQLWLASSLLLLFTVSVALREAVHCRAATTRTPLSEPPEVSVLELWDDDGHLLSEHQETRFEVRLPATDSGRLADFSGASSGARSAFPMTPFGDPFNLFSLFNVFRDPEPELLGEQGDPIGLEADQSALNPQVGVAPLVSIMQTQTNELKLAQKKAALSSVKLRGNMSKPASPVILVPGYGGSRLEARLNKPDTVRYFCERKSDWHDIWINLKLMLPYMIDCLIENFRLEFDYATNTTKNTAGVEIRVKSGATNESDNSALDTIEYLNDLPISGFAYFAPIISQLVGKLNYEREISVRGAPYDFRKAPNELSDYFEHLKETSEQTFNENKRKPVTYVCHSMGCNNMLYFLQRQPKQWKDTYVKRLISIAAPWGGCLSAMRAAALGDDLGMPYLFSESKLIRVQRSLPSTIFLFPHKQAFPDAPLIRLNVETQTRHQSKSDDDHKKKKTESSNTQRSTESFERAYTAHDFKNFFHDINHPDGYQIWLNTKDLLGDLEAPGVEVWCLVGRGHKTLGRLEYTGDFPQSSSVELFDDGDGTVSLQSARYCRKWSDEQEEPVFYREFETAHMDILKDPKLLDYLERVLLSEKPKGKI